jgi:hypothetical protein
MCSAPNADFFSGLKAGYSGAAFFAATAASMRAYVYPE